MSLISVLLCNYNYGRFIGRAIESVLAQTHENFELIIVDDASDDESREVINGYDDPRIQRIYHDTNQGQAAAFNSAFAASSGDLIALLDSDDWWLPDKLAVAARWHIFLEGDYAIWQHGLTVVQDDGQQWAYRRILPTGDAFLHMRLTGIIDYFMPTSGLVFPRTVLIRVMPIPNMLRIAADAYLTRCAIVFGRVYADPKCLGYYRKHQNSVLGNSSFDHKSFFEDQLAPLLNEFYRRQGIDFHYDPTMQRRLTFGVQLVPPNLDDPIPLSRPSIVRLALQKIRQVLACQA